VGSERSRAERPDPADVYQRQGVEVVDITGATAERSSEALGAALDGDEVERLVVAGGDGLVHLAIQHLGGSGIPLGIVPSGTGNDFANALGLDDSAPPATALSDASPVDLIELEGDDGYRRLVATIVIAGFPARINARANRSRLPLGSAIYAVAAAAELPRFSRELIELTIDGESVTTDSAMLAIGNTRFFGGGMLACPDALPDDGSLHLTSIEGVGRIGILRHLSGRAGGTADRAEVLRRTAESIRIRTVGIELWGDGEPLTSAPAAIRILPGALMVAGVPGSGR